jgi:hypothetical protein
MSTQISSQANKLWQIVSAPSTAESYKQALAITGTILRETATLLWLVVCLFLVVFDWFWNSSIALGQKARAWVNRFDNEDSSQKASRMGQEIMAASQSSLNYLITQAREQLGMTTNPETNSSSADSIPSGAVQTTQIPVNAVSPQEKQKVGEDEEVESEGNFIGMMGTEATSPPPTEMQAVVVKEVSPAQKTRPGEDEEVPMTPTKES